MPRGFYAKSFFIVLVAVLILSGFKPLDRSAATADGQLSENVDIVLIGSELEGIYLAKAALDEGLSVKILDPRDQLGGQLLQGEMLYLDEPFADGGTSLLQGRVKHLFDEVKSGDIRKIGEFTQYYRSLTEGMQIESGVELTNIEMLEDPATHKKKIDFMEYRTKDGVTKTITANYWVENTDFSALSSRLGLHRIPGIETVFGGQRDYMAASLMMKFRDVDWDKFKNDVAGLSKLESVRKYGSDTIIDNTFAWGFRKVAETYKSSDKNVFLRGFNIINQRDGEALINALFLFHVDPSDEASIAQAMELGKRETQLILPLLRKALPGWEHAELNGYPNYLYIRDYDRYETDYVLQATDVMGGRMFWDNVSIAGYSLDLQGTRANNWGEIKGEPDKYGMPLRSFIPKGFTNVILAGKNVGASAVAYGSARIQANTALAAEVIGILLGQTKGKQNLAQLSVMQMGELQAYIKEKYNITLSGVMGANKIAKWSESQAKRLNQGRIVVPRR